MLRHLLGRTVLALVGTMVPTACSCDGGGPIGSDAAGHTDGRVADGPAMLDASAVDGLPLDAGPPAAFCPDGLVRRVIGQKPEGAELFRLRVASARTHDLMIATFSQVADDNRVRSHRAWAVERDGGEVVQVWDRQDISDIVDLRVSQDRRHVSWLVRSDLELRARVRWTAGDDAAASTSVTVESGAPVLAKVSAEEDVLLSIEEVPGAPGQFGIVRWSWPTGGEPVRERVAHPDIEGWIGPPDRMTMAVATALQAGVGLALLQVHFSGGSDAEGRFLWLDPDARRIEETLPFRGADLLGHHEGVVQLAPDALALGLERGGEGVREVWRARRGGLDRHVVFREDRVPVAAGGSADGAFYVVRQPDLVGVDPEEWSHESPLFLVRLGAEPGEMEGGGRPVLTGTCFDWDVAVPPVGGAVLGTGCWSPETVDLTYFCVPGVR